MLKYIDLFIKVGANLFRSNDRIITCVYSKTDIKSFDAALSLYVAPLGIDSKSLLVTFVSADGDSEDQRRRSRQQLKIAFPHSTDMQQPSGGMRRVA
jgi:hypothetical protein